MEWLLAVGLANLTWLQGAQAFSVALRTSFSTTSGVTFLNHAFTDRAATTLAPAPPSRRRCSTVAPLASFGGAFPDNDSCCCHSAMSVAAISSRRRRSTRALISSTEGVDEEEEMGEVEDGPRRGKGLLRRIVKRVVKTGKVIGQQASHRRIRGDGGGNDEDDAPWYPEVANGGVPTEATSTEASAASPSTAATGRTGAPHLPPNSNASVNTPPPREGDSSPGSRSKSLVRQQGAVPKGSRLARKGMEGEEGMGGVARSNGGPAWSLLDAAVRPLQAFAAVMQKQAEAVESELSRRVSGLEENLRQERVELQKALESERLASKEKLKQAEEKLARLRDLSAEKRRVEEGAEKLKADAEQASAAYNASVETLRTEADSMGKRLEKERASLAASQAETAALRASQERERARAQESLAKLEAELEREWQSARAKQASMTTEMSARDLKQSRALEIAEKRAAAAELERGRAENARAKAQARAESLDTAVSAANSKLEEIGAKAERGVSLARKETEAAVSAAEKAAAEKAEAERFMDESGISRLRGELEAATTELRAQTKKAEVLKGAKERAEAQEATRTRGLEELMEKNRARNEKALAGLREEVKELGLLRVAAAGFEDVKAKLGLAQSRSSQLEGEVTSLKKKVETLDQQLAQSARRSLEESRVLEKKDRTLREAEAQLQAARERSAQLEGELVRVPTLQKSLQEAKEEAQEQRRRADELQAEREQAAAQDELVKDKVFDLERSVEMSEWSGRKLAKENEGLQGLIKRNRSRYERELARLTEASADLADKTVALQELETVLIRERESAQELGRQVEKLKAQAAATTAELTSTRDKLTRETDKRVREEAALRLATDKSYVEKLQAADRALLEVRQEGQAAVDQLQAVLNEERTTWDTERSTFTKRLEQALQSSKEFSARIERLEGESEQLRRESQQNKAEAEDLRRQLQRARTSANEANAENERLRGELVEVARDVEDRSRLQQTVAHLQAALQKVTNGKLDPPFDDKSSTRRQPSPSSMVEPRTAAAGSSTSVSAEVGSDLTQGAAAAAVPPDTTNVEGIPGAGARDATGNTAPTDAVKNGSGETRTVADGSESGRDIPFETSPSSSPLALLLQAREQLAEAASSLTGAKRENAERYSILLGDSEVCKSVETASAIDEFLERSEDTVTRGSDNEDASPASPASEGSVKRDLDDEGDAGGVAATKKGARRMSNGGWIGSSRWSKTGRARR